MGNELWRVGPKPPYFYEEKKEVSVGFNGSYFPDKEWLLKCRTTIDELLKWTDEEVKEHNNWVDECERDEELERSRERIKWEKERKAENKRGFIYVIESGGLYKIGKTNNPKDRVKAYKTENPHGITCHLMISVNNYSKKETELLKHFKDKLVVGKEWFNLVPSDIQTIKAMCA